MNAKSELLVDFCSKRATFMSNNYIQHMLIYRYTWKRGGGRNKESLGSTIFVIFYKQRSPLMKNPIVLKKNTLKNYSMLKNMDITSNHTGNVTVFEIIKIRSHQKMEDEILCEEYQITICDKYE